jgi:prevent-host-death family protein
MCAGNRPGDEGRFRGAAMIDHGELPGLRCECDGRSRCATLARMSLVASRELRNNTRQLLKRVEAGESITITVDGAPVATLAPVGRRSRWMSKEEFLGLVIGHQADPGLISDLRALTPDSTADIPLR